jgi:hypothetical protein
VFTGTPQERRLDQGGGEIRANLEYLNFLPPDAAGIGRDEFLT